MNIHGRIKSNLEAMESLEHIMDEFDTIIEPQKIKKLEQYRKECLDEIINDIDFLIEHC